MPQRAVLSRLLAGANVGGRDMPVERLMIGSSLAPKSVAAISAAYTVVLSELRVDADCDEAGELAKLLLRIASDETELNIAALVAKAKAAWRDRSSSKG